jgi:hypothetical protein
MSLLDQRHHDHLTGSAIADDVIAERGYYSLIPGDYIEAANLLAVKPATAKPAMHGGALVIPLHRLGDTDPYAHVLRPDLPTNDKDGRPRKYLYPAGVSNILDVLPRHKDALGDPAIPLWITEGAKKADALTTAFGSQIVAIDMNGVTGWRATNANGGKTVTPDLQSIAFNGREVIVCPDGDYKTNRNVQKGINELVQLLEGRYSVAMVYICMMPQDPSGAKMGVDDYFAQGGTIAELKTFLQPLTQARAQARTTFLAHPDTGAALMAPYGYSVIDKKIVRVPDGYGAPQPVYSGAIFVRSTGLDLQTERQTVTIAWSTPRGLRERTVTADTLSNRRAFSEHIGAAGASIHEGNIKNVMTFLGEFIPENSTTIPSRLESSTYGYVKEGLVLSDRTLGFTEPVIFTGDGPRITVGKDGDAYPTALRDVAANWDAPVFWLTLALALSGPVIARMRPRRNPVLGLFGESGSGKTTVALFATGAFGLPNAAPLKLEAGRSTTAGLFQSLERLGGLPLLIDEAHTHPHPDRLSGDIYQFANGQSYTRGGADGNARGGTTLAGSLILCGEAIPEFRHAGSRNRVLFVDTAEHAPMGAERQSLEGERRAHVLEAAWDAGAGLFAPRVLEVIWRDWNTFRASVADWRDDARIGVLGPWREPLAVALEVMFIAAQTIGIDTMVGADTMAQRWADMLRRGHERTDPAGDAWEHLLLMLNQARLLSNTELDGVASTHTPATWEYLEANRGGGAIACRKVTEGYWRVPTNTPQFTERVGMSAAQEFGREWMRRGLVIPAADGSATERQRIYPRGLARVLSIPVAHVNPDDVPPSL